MDVRNSFHGGCRKFKGHHFGDPCSVANFVDDQGTVEGQFIAERSGELRLEFKNDAMMTTKTVCVYSICVYSMVVMLVEVLSRGQSRGVRWSSTFKRCN